MTCGDITDVEVDNNQFIAHTTEEFNYNMISQDYSKNEIEKAFKWFGCYYKFVPVLEQKVIDKQIQDIERLKSIFKEIKIIE